MIRARLLLALVALVAACTPRAQLAVWHAAQRQTLERQWFAAVNASQPWAVCVKAHESDTAGGYRAVSPNGKYRGAYQDDQTTWDTFALWAGRPDLIGIRPDTAPWWDQENINAVGHARDPSAWAGDPC